MRFPSRVVALTSLLLLGCPGTTQPPAMLEVTPSTLALAVGETRTVTAQVKQGEALTPATGATWTSSDATVASVSGNADGTATVQALAAGTATLQAKFADLTASVSVTVTSTTATLTRLELTPSTPSLAAGTTQQLTATGVYSDGTMLDLSSMATWASGDTAVATVSSTGLVSGVTAGSTMVTASFGGRSASVAVTVTAATLSSIEVTPALPSIAVSTTQAFVATGVFSDGSTQDLSSQVTWSSSDNAVATVDATGVATGVAEGNALITATQGGVSGGTTLTVTAATLTAIEVTPTGLSLAKGLTRQLVATGTFSDGTTQDVTSQTTWSSATTAAVTVSTSGEATAVDVGSSVVTATVGTVSGTVTVTVTAATLLRLEVTPTTPSVAAGLTQQFVATGVYTDATTQVLTDQVVWTSASLSIATVSNAAGSHGLATMLSPGNVIITAASGTITGDADLTVTAATLVGVNIGPAGESVPVGTTLQFNAMGTFSDGTLSDITSQVTWTTGAATTATISNAAGSHGLLTGVAVGSTSVRGTLNGLFEDVPVVVTAAQLSRIDITPMAPSLAMGRTQQLTATGVYTDGTTVDLTDTATWTSATPAVASVSNATGSEGLLTALTEGTSVISVQSGAITGSTTVTVTAAVLTAIELTPAMVNLPKGLTQQLTATGRYSDNSVQPLTTQVTWATSASTVATVSNAAGSHGLLQAVDVGTADITATFSGITGTLGISVTAPTLTSITVTPATVSVAKGRTQQFTATGNYSDGTTQPLTTQATWASSATAAVTVSNMPGSNGLATAVDGGPATVTATFSGISGSATMTVTAAELVSLTVLPANASLAKGRTQQYTVIGTYTDGTQPNLTTQVTWSTSNPTAAGISNAPGSHGLLTALEQGTSNVSASLDGVTGSTGLTVTAAAVVSIVVTPANASVAKGRTRQYTATATFSDATIGDVTTQVTWSTSAPGTADVSNAAGSHGLLSALALGSATVFATSGTVTSQTTVTVTAPELVSITLAPTSVTAAQGATAQLTATGHYSDTTQQDVTDSVTWASVDTGVATVSATGLVTTVSVGATSVSATQGTVTASVSVTVTPVALTSIEVTPSAPIVSKGHTQQFVATAHYSNGTSADVSSTVTWTSSSTATATLDATGLASTHAQGTSTITATLGTVSDTAELTVTVATVDAITVTPTSPAVVKTQTTQLTATATMSDGTFVDVTHVATWTTGDSAIATIQTGGGFPGVATGVLEGTTTATATMGLIVNSVQLKVWPAALVSIDVQPNPLDVLVGGDEAVTATGHFADGSTDNVGAQATWASSNTAAVTVVNGLVHGVAPGTANVTATIGAVVGTTAVTSAHALVSIDVVGPAVVRNNVLVPYTATAHYSDGSTANVTQTATWASSATTAATVTNTGTRGVLEGTAAGGVTNVTATVGTVTGTLSVRVNGAAGSVGVVNHLVISQVYGGGGNSGAPFTNDFVELHNPTNADISLNGMSIQYTSAAGNTWTGNKLDLPDRIVPPGGYFLIQLGAGGTPSAALPTPDATGTIAMSGTAGKVVLVASTAVLPSGCPAAAVDVVSFGPTATCSETLPTAVLSNSTAAIRRGAGCVDTNHNQNDFDVATPTPRNSSSTRVECDVYVNDLTAPEEVNFCVLQFPASLNETAGATSATVYSRVFQAGVTEAAGAPANVVMQLGYGPASSSALTSAAWKWRPTTYNVQVGNDDEFQGSFVVPAAGSYAYTTRVSLDGVHWTLCDLNGAGSNSGLVFEAAQQGVLTVSP